MNSSPDAAVDVDFGPLTPVAPPEPAPSLEQAARSARRLVAAAEAEADRVRDEARAAGHAEGLAAGRAEALAEAAPSLSAAVAALAAVRAMEADATDRVERHAVDLAMQVAERVVAGTIAVSPERLLDVVRGALRTIIERERVTLLVHPEDLDLMREGVAEVTGALGGIEHIEVQEERRVARGGAILRTRVGEVDARIETKLERVRSAIEKELSP
ncbi:MAG: flagellar assembly protein FliH [Thermoleophilaceae bacterium]|jgi:flagellar assembly protein FliH|nr:flagellar assembly protein FliH [Thermoleophilaceae bacterium]